MRARVLGKTWSRRKAVEDAFQAQVEKLAGALGWLGFHMPPNVVQCPYCGHKIYRGVRRGFPDLVLVRTMRLPPGPLRWLELKTESGSVDPDQRQVHELLRRSGQAVDVIKPHDSDYLLEILRDESR